MVTIIALALIVILVFAFVIVRLYRTKVSAFEAEIISESSESPPYRFFHHIAWVALACVVLATAYVTMKKMNLSDQTILFVFGEIITVGISAITILMTYHNRKWLMATSATAVIIIIGWWLLADGLSIKELGIAIEGLIGAIFIGPLILLAMVPIPYIQDLVPFGTRLAFLLGVTIGCIGIAPVFLIEYRNSKHFRDELKRAKTSS